MYKILFSLIAVALLAIPAEANPPFRFGVVVQQPIVVQQPVVVQSFSFATAAPVCSSSVALTGNVSVFRQNNLLVNGGYGFVNQGFGVGIGVGGFGFRGVGVGVGGFGFRGVGIRGVGFRGVRLRR